MRNFAIGVGLLWMLAGSACADEAAVAKAIVGYQEAFNQRDLARIETSWSESGVLEDRSAGTKLIGRNAIIGQIKEVFAQENPPHLSISTDASTVQEDQSIRVTGINTLTHIEDEQTISESFAFTAVIRSVDGRWQIAEVTESALNDDPTPPNSIEPFRWLVGVWTATNEDGPAADAPEMDAPEMIVNEFRFMQGDRFMVRTFSRRRDTAEESLGYQIIGSVPGDDRLRCWSFLSDGSVSQGVLNVDPHRVSIESSGRLADGSEAAGTHVIKRIDDHSFSLQLVGHTINGEPVPSLGTVILQRQTQIPEGIR